MRFNNILYVLTCGFVLFSFCGSKSRDEHRSKNVVARQAIDTSALKIVAKPIVFDSLRKQLSLEYIFMHYGLKLEEPTIHPQMIVIHHTAIDAFDLSFKTMYGSILPKARKEIKKEGLLNVSSHYLIDRDGTVYQLLPDTVFARHTIGLNPIAIGIENVGGRRLPLTTAQLNSNARLVRLLKQKYPSIQWMIGHKEYGKFRGSKLWMEKDRGYFTIKHDPEGNFMEMLRSRLSDLALKSEPVE
jgi:N-acetylmuramoyl-L-alanine amidase